MDYLLVTLDLVGTFVFALSGALVGVRHRLDLFGVLVLSFVAANGGGVMRDTMIGATPPAALQDWRYVAISIAAGLVTFWRAGAIERWRNPVQSIDALGLGVFAVAGALKAQAFGLGPVGAMLLGMLTGIGGGMIRDVLVAQVPTVLKAELYAIAALVGAGVVVLGTALSLPLPGVVVAGVAACTGLRLFAIRRGWKLPVARPPA
ncbi:MAG TPA: trimeric intracellular cation channel family protein [Arenimonas sp.]|uniref:trimeric intracellular cation channel family protein n=1 Tax=Arenimonas sp. TaxID=1872635 RepID=UPI002D7F8E1B|nr:trimeric intracellular cation channel family protein [Arenimonas sp.]HEU0153662.1 trimeric intracellular cation channel family protein [Arenimonas sp.]